MWLDVGGEGEGRDQDGTGERGQAFTDVDKNGFIKVVGMNTTC